VRRKAKRGNSTQKTTYLGFPKAGIACDTASHRKLAVFRRVGSVGIGAIAGCAFFVLAIALGLIRGYFIVA